MKNDYTLIIKGFTSMAQVKAFADWYDAQGEQDSAIWFECRQDKGEIDCSYIGVDNKVPKIKTKTSLTITVKPLE
jgi:hypothetical protein